VKSRCFLALNFFEMRVCNVEFPVLDSHQVAVWQSRRRSRGK
jgi:hypothetical protein